MLERPWDALNKWPRSGQVNVMGSASPEKLGLKLLRALKREKDSGKSLLDCRSLSAIAAELRFSDSERENAIRFLTDLLARVGKHPKLAPAVGFGASFPCVWCD
jgi:hypothetical protein